MLVGWWQVLRHPRSIGRGGDADEIVQVEPGRLKRSPPTAPMDAERSVGIAMDPIHRPVPFAAPEPGEVNKRHETTTLFFGDEEEEEERGFANRHGFADGDLDEYDDGRVDEVMQPGLAR